MLRRTLALILFASLLGAAPARAGFAWFETRPLVSVRQAPAGSGPTFVVSGHGWGHGVGMAQWGAYGYAQHGFAYTKILAHYYPGTTLGSAPVARVRVLLVSGAATVRISSATPFKVRDADGKQHALDPGTYPLGAGLKVKARDAEKPAPLPPPLVFSPGAQPLKLGDRAYRGQLVVSVASGKLRVVNSLGLEAYVSGVVPREMPYSWLPEALKAQAVAARSYALSHLTKGTGFDLYDDVRSQVYGGVAAERPSTNAAVTATAGQVLLYGGRVANTVFFSSSGGRTMAAADAWGGVVPYLVSVPDPYDTISPYHDWGPFAYTGARLAKVLRAPGGKLVDVQLTLNGSGRVAAVTAVGTKGEATVPGQDVRQRLGLRSTWFSVGVLSLLPPEQRGPVTWGARARLTGIARGFAEVWLQQRPAGARLWQSVAVLRPEKTGALSLAPKPAVSTRYRLAAGTVAAAPVSVSVAPLVRLATPTAPTALRGTVRPIVAGLAVTIQRQDGTAWRSVGRGTVDAQGAFEARLALRSGLYRARVAPGHGLVAGTSAALKVVTE